jgi:hypothetical protein
MRPTYWSLTPERIEWLSWIALGLSVAAMLIFIVAASRFALPGVDDWCFGADRLDPISRANHLYQTWSGRWLAMASAATLTHLVDLTGNGYRVAAIAVSGVLWLLGFFFVAKQVVAGWRRQLLWSMLLLVVFWAGSPRPMEVFYWLVGVVCYAPAFALTAASLLMVKRNQVFAASALAFAAALFNELATLTALPFMAVIAYRDRRQIAPLAAMLAGFVIVAVAPGNNLRFHHLARPSVAWVVWAVIRPYLSPLALIAELRLWALVALVLALPNGDRPNPKDWLVWPACALAGVLGSAIAATWAASTTLEPRVLAYMFAVLLSAAFVTAYQMRGVINSRIVRVGAALALAVSLPACSNVSDIVRVLPESLNSVRNLNRYWQAIRAQQGKDAAIPALGQVAYMGTYQPYIDPADPTNVCEAQYLGLRSIRLRR